MNKILLVTLLLVQTNLMAEVNFEAPSILARSNVKDSYNLPALSYLSNVAPVINNNGEVAFKVIATGEEGVQGLWVKAHQDQNGKILYTAPEEKVVTDPSINDQGLIAFSLFDDVGSDGLFTLDAQSLKVTHVFNAEKSNLDFFTYPTINNKNEIYFRGTDKANDRKIYRFFDKTISPLVEEGVEISGNIGSYIFKPVINQNGMMAFKMRLGKKGAWDETNPDLIALYNPASEHMFDSKGNDLGAKPGIKIIAFDRDFDQTSHNASFLNSVSLSNAQHVGFASLTDDGRIQVNIYMPNGEIKKVALENEGDILNVETFSVKVNSQGHLIFRGKNKLGKRCIFFFDGSNLKKLIGEGDEIDSDLGLAKILDNQYYPGISGEIDINDNDQIVFGVVLQNARDNHEIGQAIYQLNPKK